MTEATHALAAAVYAAGALIGARSLRGGRVSPLVAWLLALGSVMHAVGFVALHRESPPVPLESFPAALSLIGWLIAVSYLLSLGFARIRGVGTWVGAAAGGFTALALLGLWLRPPSAPVEPLGPWSHAHVLLSTLGFSLLGLASLAGLAYLAKERALKRKRASRLGLPSLESLDRMEHLTLSLGFPLLTLGVVTGFAWGLDRGLSFWTSHTLWLLGAWLIYLLPMGLRVVSRQHGERPARTVVLGFLVLAASYLGVRLLEVVA